MNTFRQHCKAKHLNRLPNTRSFLFEKKKKIVTSMTQKKNQLILSLFQINRL